MKNAYLIIKVDNRDYYSTEYEILGTYRNKKNAEEHLKRTSEILALEMNINLYAELVVITFDD